jgi:hypothetical protein
MSSRSARVVPGTTSRRPTFSARASRAPGEVGGLALESDRRAGRRKRPPVTAISAGQVSKSGQTTQVLWIDNTRRGGRHCRVLFSPAVSFPAPPRLPHPTSEDACVTQIFPIHPRIHGGPVALAALLPCRPALPTAAATAAARIALVQTATGVAATARMAVAVATTGMTVTRTAITHETAGTARVAAARLRAVAAARRTSAVQRRARAQVAGPGRISLGGARPPGRARPARTASSHEVPGRA